MGPGDFTTGGHFIVLTGIDSDGNVIVNDPNSRINSEKHYFSLPFCLAAISFRNRHLKSVRTSG
ncbi:MAG: C39 family peptidase [Clostridiales bacterium]|nr:C39 family peptidase [Clostridiales bacterium]